MASPAPKNNTPPKATLEPAPAPEAAPAAAPTPQAAPAPVAPAAPRGPKWYQKTSLYIAEYIIMLFFMGGLIGVLISNLFSFFNLVASDGGFSARAMAQVAAVGLGSLIVLTPATWILYSRVSNEEQRNEAVTKNTARTVFMVIWLVSSTGTLLIMASIMIWSLISLLFGFSGNNSGKTIVTTTIPAFLSLFVAGAGLLAVLKSRVKAFAKPLILGLVITAGVVLILNIIMIAVRKDSDSSGSSSSPCTYSRYMDRECSYSEYRDYINERSRSLYDY